MMTSRYIPVVHVPLSAVFDLADESPSPEQLAIDANALDNLKSKLAALLSPRAYSVVCMLYIDGHTTAEVAAHLMLSESSVKHIRRLSLRVLKSDPAFVSMLL
jgi:DNA-directed RNA polymerase specialized sigma24 family protein